MESEKTKPAARALCWRCGERAVRCQSIGDAKVQMTCGACGHTDVYHRTVSADGLKGHLTPCKDGME